MARLLIVDDDPDILKMAEKILVHAGHQVSLAENALKAIDLLDNGTFDVLVSDANMPLCSGFELVQTVRANPRHQNLSVAMLTGLRDRKDVEKAVRAGVDDYIVKPLDPMLLVQKIGALIDKRQPEVKPEIRFTPETVQAAAVITAQVQMESISELGVVIRTNMSMKVGQTADLQAAFFEQLGDKVPPLKVLAVTPLPDKADWYRVEFVFLGASESLLQKIRRYIFQHGASNRAVS
ncbi:MAG: response regulator [Bdellovibrionales bacterium]